MTEPGALPPIPPGYLVLWSDLEHIPEGWKVVPWPEVDAPDLVNLPPGADPPAVPLVGDDGRYVVVMIEKL
jgi:hypothetical protein